MVSVSVDLDFPDEVRVIRYKRHQDGHGFWIDWTLPETCSCDVCHKETSACIEYKSDLQSARHLDLWGQVSFLLYYPPFHRCPFCGHRQHLLPPFKRKDVTYTYHFEEQVLFMMIGSNQEEVARRLGISAETVDLIIRNRLADDKQVDPNRVIRSIGLDEISLKKGHKLYVTILTDLTDPANPKVLAVMKDRDSAAARKCLALMTQEQRQAIKTHRTDMCKAYPSACSEMLPNSRNVADRFHVAKQFNKVIDKIRRDLTREYKQKLSKAELKAFRALMWEFRSPPEKLSPKRTEALEGLFEKIPKLEELHKIRLRFKEIFDTAPDRTTAARWLRELKAQSEAQGLDLSSFWTTYDNWKTPILNYFDDRETSGPVEGINNKARVITKRSYGLKSADGLWDRLILDLNRAMESIGRTIQQVRDTLAGLKALFEGVCT